MISFNQHSYDRDHELALIENFMREGVNDLASSRHFLLPEGQGRVNPTLLVKLVQVR